MSVDLTRFQNLVFITDMYAFQYYEPLSYYEVTSNDKDIILKYIVDNIVFHMCVDF